MDKHINPSIKSFYYNDRDEIPELSIKPEKTVLAIMNMQKYQIGRVKAYAMQGRESGTGSNWKDFYDRLDYITLPAIQEVLAKCRELGIKVAFGKVAGLSEDEELNELIDDYDPFDDELIYVRYNKIGSSLTAGTSFAEDMRAEGIDTVIVVGVATDQCISSTVRALSDEGFNVICVDDACAADSMEQHDAEMKALNFTYCLVLSLLQIMDILGQE